MTMFLNLCGLREACPLSQVSLQTTACDSVLLTCLPYGCQTPLRLPPAPCLGPAPAQDSRPWSPPERPRVARAGKRLQVGPATRTQNSHSPGFCPGGPHHHCPPSPPAGPRDCPPLFAPILPFSHGNPSPSLRSCNSSFSRPRLFPDQSPRQQAGAASLGVDIPGGTYKTSHFAF